jgi:hypothetical protein
VKAGGASVRLRLTDAAANHKSYDRKVHVPQRD